VSRDSRGPTFAAQPDRAALCLGETRDPRFNPVGWGKFRRSDYLGDWAIVGERTLFCVRYATACCRVSVVDYGIDRELQRSAHPPEHASDHSPIAIVSEDHRFVFAILTL
jgi:hypothetical protein